MQRKMGPRAEYRQQENLRISESATLAEKYLDLKSLTVELVHYGSNSFARTSEMKYTVNLAHAKSLFLFCCPNDECVGGDFDLSGELANAVAARHQTASGEMICQGWRNKSSIDQVHCHNILRYKLSVGY